MLGIQGLSQVQNRVDGGKWSSIHKFGSNPGLDPSSEETIWSAGGLYPWAALAAPQVLFVSSVEPADDGTVTIQGLDQDWALLEETVSLAGSPSEINTINTFRRVYRAFYTGATHTGLITIRTLSHAGTIVAQIDVGKAQTLMTVYTVPVGCLGYLVGYTAGVGKLDDADIFLYTGVNGQNFRIKSEMSIYQSVQHQPFTIPLAFGEKTDIDFRATGSTGNSFCTLNYDLVLRRL